MKKVAAWIILPVFFFTMAFLHSNFAGAQQQSDSSSAGVYPTAGASVSTALDSTEPGLYPSSTSDQAAQMGIQSAGRKSPMSRESRDAAAAQADAARSAWNAGASAMGEASRRIPVGGDFRVSGASWTAGKESFGLQRQAGGIWRVGPSAAALGSASSEATGVSLTPGPDLSGVQTGAPASAARSGAGRAASIQHASRFGQRYRYSGSSSGTHGPKFPSKGKSPASPYRRQFNSIGTGTGSGSSGSASPSGSPASPALNDSLNPNLDLNRKSNPR